MSGFRSLAPGVRSLLSFVQYVEGHLGSQDKVFTEEGCGPEEEGPEEARVR